MTASQSLDPESRKRGRGEERKGRETPTHPKHKPTRGTQKFLGPRRFGGGGGGGGGRGGGGGGGGVVVVVWWWWWCGGGVVVVWWWF